MLFFAVLLLAGLLAGFAVKQVFSLSWDARQLATNVGAVQPLGTMAKDMQQLTALAEKRHILSTLSSADAANISAGEMDGIRQAERATAAEFAASWKRYQPTMDPGRETQDGNSFKASFDQLVASAHQIISSDDVEDNAAALKIRTGDFQNEYSVFTQAMDDDLAYQDSQTSQSAAAADAARVQSLTWILVIFGVMLAGTLFVAWIMVQGIAGPIGAMTTVMRRLAGQDMNVVIPGVGRKDEVGKMAAAVQIFRENGLQRLQLEAQATEFQKTLDKKLSDMERAFEVAGHDQQQVVTTLGTALAAVAKGDLTARFALEVTEVYRRLKEDFNSAMSTLQETMKSIASNTQDVRSGASEITTAADDLSRRTEQQAASLEETAAALDEITATVKKTAEGAAAARKVADDARNDAEQSGVVVGETVEAMSGIESSSKKISNIIGVIDEIAFQTNLLALNAGIEAARAGDAGRGFAVVATEVRALAQRSADAAKEIKSLISTSGRQVESGVKMVGATGNALTHIVEKVTRLNGLIAEIAASAKEQASGLTEVNNAVNHMDQVTQQNAAMVEQTTAASHSLANEASELARLVGQFQIGMAEETVVSLRPEPPKKLQNTRKIAGGNRYMAP
jgi:methyl-accepting chemotaxis protein